MERHIFAIEELILDIASLHHCKVKHPYTGYYYYQIRKRKRQRARV